MSRFNFLYSDFKTLYDKCVQAEETTDISVKMLKVRQSLEYIVRELGEDGKDLFNNIAHLNNTGVLSNRISRLFQETRQITNRGIHERETKKVSFAESQTVISNLVEITVWYAAEYMKKAFVLNDFSMEDVALAKRYIRTTESIKKHDYTSERINPLQVIDVFVDTDDDAPIDPLERDVFETEAEYVDRIAQMEPVHIGYAMLDMRTNDGYTNIRFLQHHIEKIDAIHSVQERISFFADQTSEDGIIDGELVAKLRVYDQKVYCDYSRIFLRSDEQDIAVQVICWDKMGYESEDDYQERIKALPLLPLLICTPIRKLYNIEQQILPFGVTGKFAYVNIPLQDMYAIPCNRDLAKQVCATKQKFTMFGKILPTGKVEDFIIWNRETGVLFGTLRALEMKQQEEVVRQEQIQGYMNKAKSASDVIEKFVWYEKAAQMGNAEAQYWMGNCFFDTDNYEDAITWYMKAEKQGHTGAKEGVKQIRELYTQREQREREQQERKLREREEQEARERIERERREQEERERKEKEERERKAREERERKMREERERKEREIREKREREERKRKEKEERERKAREEREHRARAEREYREKIKQERNIRKQRENREEIGDFSIVVVGEFSSGKSTLINALLEKKILPKDMVPINSFITKIVYGEQSTYRFYYRDGKTEVVEKEKFMKLNEWQNRKYENIKYAEVSYPVSFCRNQIEIIDTPGFMMTNRSNICDVKKYIESADVIIHVESVEFVTSNLWLEYDLHLDMEKTFFVLNKIDMIDEEEEDIVEIIDFYKKMIFGRTQKIPRVFAVSSALALESRKSANKHMLEESRFSIFKEALLDYLYSKNTYVPDIQRQYEYGNRYYDEKNYKEAFKWYQKAAEQGHVNAQCQLGLCYRYGLGVLSSNRDAIHWYRKASEKGNEEAKNALFALGVYY